MHRLIKPCYCILTILFFVSTAQPQDKPDDRSPIPLIPLKENIVNIKTAVSIASFFGTKEFGDGAPGRPVIGYDLNGGTRVYIITFRIGDNPFPTDEEVLGDIRSARELLPQAEAELAKVREIILKTKVVDLKFIKNGKRMYLQKDSLWEAAEQKVKDLKDRCWGIGKYYTVIVSGRKDLLPIHEYSNTLPYYYTYQDDARAMAASKLGNDIHLERFYYGGDLDQIFEYVSKDGLRAWIAIFPPRIVEVGEIKTRGILLSNEQRNYIREKWNEIIREMGNEQ